MKTFHKVIFSDSRELKDIPDQSIDLVVTSPPYPMIEMWDELFSSLNPDIGNALKRNKGSLAFELMHQELDLVWKELDRVVKPSGFVCINIGDATRTIDKHFQLYSNHTRITTSLVSLSFSALPLILWKKTTNAPNKFMGSGMLPAGAYVTLEHEYILIFRKGNKREFKTKDLKESRQKSALFWEERNTWFSDTWNLSGVRQVINDKQLRGRSAAYPFDLAYRLINMYSVKEDMILDPFLGTGTTVFAAMVSGRSSAGIEYDDQFSSHILENLKPVKKFSNEIVRDRIWNHKKFIDEYRQRKGEPKYFNEHHQLPVITNQEKLLQLDVIDEITVDKLADITVHYTSFNNRNLFLM